MDGVKRVTSQLCVATLSASCCSEQVQIIAFEPDNDFVVMPWLKSMDRPKLEKGEVIAGAGLIADEGETVFFYETDFFVKAKLEPTGMGYDNTVFMTRETAAMLKDSKAARDALPTDIFDSSVSLILVDTDDDLSEDEKLELKRSLRNLGGSDSMCAYEADEMMSEISSQVRKLSSYGSVLTAVLIAVTALALVCVFVITVNERRYEFGILCTLGAGKGYIVKMLLLEALMLCLAGSVAGVCVSWCGISIFRELLSRALDIPYFENGAAFILPIAAYACAVAVAAGTAAVIASALCIAGEEPYSLIREKNS
ncbi:MAG: ABC transporter permease, partial [Oscillospiraceae bacterium]|nr:ABC transporter permease [Oscillospiraceae bacterium]